MHLRIPTLDEGRAVDTTARPDMAGPPAPPAGPLPTPDAYGVPVRVFGPRPPHLPASVLPLPKAGRFA